MSIIKACTHCHNEYPATNEYFGLRKDSKQGLTSWCKACIAERSIQTRLNKGGKRAQYVQRKDGRKQCTKCREWFPETAEYFNRTSRLQDGLHTWCKSCTKTYLKQRKIDNPEKVKEQKKRDYEKHKDKRLLTCAQYYENHRDDYIARARKQEHDPVKHLIRLHRRLARKRSLPDNFTKEEWQSCLEYFDYQCAVCGCKDRPLQMDHWIPLNDPNCPGTVAKNIIPLCGQTDGCNQSKNRKHPEEWLVERYGLQEAQIIMSAIDQYLESL